MLYNYQIFHVYREGRQHPVTILAESYEQALVSLSHSHILDRWHLACVPNHRQSAACLLGRFTQQPLIASWRQQPRLATTTEVDLALF